MERTLYLTEHENLRAFADGPSILINMEKKSLQRVPLRLINRVVIVGNFLIETGLLYLLADHNIPVLILDLTGKKKAMSLPLSHNYQLNFKFQKVFITSSRYRERFINWAKIKRMNLQIKLLQNLGPDRSRYKIFSREVGEGNYQLIIKRFMPRETEKWEAVKNFIKGLFESLITNLAINAGLDPNIGVIHKRSHLALVQDLVFIIESLIDEQAISYFRSPFNQHLLERDSTGWKLKKDSLRNIIHRFENKRKENQEIIENVIDELFYLMKEIRI